MTMLPIKTSGAVGERFFVACPMSSFATERLYSDFRMRVLSFCEVLAASAGTLDVFFAGRHIGNFDAFDDAHDALKSDADSIWECDRFVLLYPDKILSSALVEAGIAIGLRKPVTILCRSRTDLPYVLQSADMSASTYVGPLAIVCVDFSTASLAQAAHDLVRPVDRVAAE